LAQQPPPPQWARVCPFTRFLDHTQRRTTVGRAPLTEWSARRRHLYLTTQNTDNRPTSMPSAGFEPTISAGERPQTYALDCAATGIGSEILITTQCLITDKHTKHLLSNVSFPVHNASVYEKQGSTQSLDGLGWSYVIHSLLTSAALVSYYCIKS
jgi:hypothetical protein